MALSYKNDTSQYQNQEISKNQQLLKRKENKFIMNYNQFTYYRANPYAQQGYMPPAAHQNRHKPDFMTELPMGQDHLNLKGKKQFTTNFQKSNIDNDNILKSPERYPYENRIALDKTYQRNLNTIDIEGASGGTLISQAVRNKMRARQQILRRQQLQPNATKQKIQPIINGETFQQQKRRKIAYQQYTKDQQAKQMASNRTKQEPTLQSNRYLQMNNYDSNETKKFSQAEQNIQNRFYMKNQRKKDQQYELRPRYQSIDVSSLSNHNQDSNRRINDSYSYKQKSRQQVEYQNKQLRYRQQPTNSGHSYRDTQYQNQKPSSNKAKSQRYVPQIKLPTDKRSLRLQNPTNLSSQGPIHLAAVNIMKNV